MRGSAYWGIPPSAAQGFLAERRLEHFSACRRARPVLYLLLAAAQVVFPPAFPVDHDAAAEENQDERDATDDDTGQRAGGKGAHVVVRIDSCRV